MDIVPTVAGKVTEDFWEGLQAAINAGLVREQQHSSFPLSIYNYTQRCSNSRHWDNITRACRGLVIDRSNRRLVIPCVPKFFNQFEPEAAKVDLNNCRITMKNDGYMIQILEDEQYGLLVTSRGSFDSRYADYARNMLGSESLIKGLNYVCELCHDFPGDEAIIVTRHPTDKLYCWSVLDRSYREHQLELPSVLEPTRVFTATEAAEYMNGQVEGIVIEDLATQGRIKCKTDWFIAMHRAISGISRRGVWDSLRHGDDVPEQFAVYKVVDGGEQRIPVEIPDELLPTVDSWVEELSNNYHSVVNEIDSWSRVTIERGMDNRAIANNQDLGISRTMKSLLFMKNKGKEEAMEQTVWRMIKPKGEEDA